MILDTSYQVTGIIQANPMSQSVAIIAVDGKPTKAYSMDMEVIPGSALNTVSSNYILLMDNGIAKRVELPKDAPAPITPVRFMSPAISNSIPRGANHATSSNSLVDAQHRALNLKARSSQNVPQNRRGENNNTPPGPSSERRIPSQQFPPTHIPPPHVLPPNMQGSQR